VAALACHLRSLLYHQHAGHAVSKAEAAALQSLRELAGVPAWVSTGLTQCWQAEAVLAGQIVGKLFLM
jgi:uncharacterized protein YaaW (UPF0174 family)